MHRPMTLSQLPSVAAVVGWLALGVCAPIVQDPKSVTERPASTTRETIPDKGVDASVKQNGTILEVQTNHTCSVQTTSVVARTTRIESRNGSPGITWAEAGLAVAAGAVGTIMIVDASNVYPNDKRSRTYNATGADTARGWGVGTAALGGVLATVAVVDVVRANQETEYTQETTEEPEVTQTGVRCKKPYSGASVVGKLGETGTKLGKADVDGHLKVDLDAIIEPSFVPTPDGSMIIVVDGAKVGNASLAPLYGKREQRAWSAPAVAACSNPVAPDSCGPLQEYLRDFPGGPHASLARKMLERSRPKLEELTKAEMWRRVDMAACETGKANDSPSDISAACDPLQEYVTRFPEAEHASEARTALNKGLKRKTALEAKLNQEAEQATERVVKGQEAEERRQKAEQARRERQEKEKERREAQRERAACQANCEDTCILSRYRGDRLQACIRLCVRNRCTEE